MPIRSVNAASIFQAASYSLAAPIVSLLFPQECGLCGNGVGSLDLGKICQTCWSKAIIFDQDSQLCEKCGGFNTHRDSVVPMQCGRCEDCSFDTAFAIGPYQHALRETVLALKSTPHLPRIAIRHISPRLENLSGTVFDTIIPVPLSRQRRFERGFNQAEIIAEAVSRLTRLPVDRNSLHRRAHTPMHRSGMDQKAREKSVKNAFAVARPRMIEGRNVLLTDDVLTSGATASACANVLKAHGALTVNVFTIARAEFRR